MITMGVVSASSTENAEAEWIVMMTAVRLKEIHDSVNWSDVRGIILRRKGVRNDINRGALAEKHHAVYNVRCFLMRIQMQLMSGEWSRLPTYT